MSEILSKTYIGRHVKHPLFLSDLIKKKFSTDVQKLPKYHVLWKSVKWEPSCSMRAEGQTDRQTWQS